MTSRLWWQTVLAVVVAICITLILRFAFIKTASILSLFGLGLLVAYVMDPLLDALERRNFSRVAAVWTVTVGFLVIIAIIGILIVPRVVSQVQDAANNWRQYSDTVQVSYHHWREVIERYSKQRLPNIEVMPFIDAKVDQATEWLASNLPTFLQWISQQLIASIGLVVLGGLLVLISFHFMLIIDPLRRQVREMLPGEADCEVNRLGNQINAMLLQYLRGVVIVSVLVGISATLLLYIHSIFFATKYALILGIITGITYMIPYIGPIISAVGAGFFGYVTAAQGSPWLSSLTALGAMYLVNQVYDMVVTPRIVGQRVGLHPLLVLFSVMTGFALLGLPGMIIATPAAASIKILLARWLPIKGIDFEAPCPRRRLDLDLPATINMVARGVVRISRDLEGVLRQQHAPEEAAEETEVVNATEQSGLPLDEAPPETTTDTDSDAERS